VTAVYICWLSQVFPGDIRDIVAAHPDRANLLEVILDLGRRPEVCLLHTLPYFLILVLFSYFSVGKRHAGPSEPVMWFVAAARLNRMVPQYRRLCTRQSSYMKFKTGVG
jgi:hypothetical protein